MRLAATLPSNTLICQIALKKFETGCFTNNLLKAIHVHWTEIDNIKISDTAFEINTEEYVFYIPSGTQCIPPPSSIWQIQEYWNRKKYWLIIDENYNENVNIVPTKHEIAAWSMLELLRLFLGKQLLNNAIPYSSVRKHSLIWLSSTSWVTLPEHTVFISLNRLVVVGLLQSFCRP